MKFLKNILPLVAALLLANPAALAEDTPDSPCVPPSTVKTESKTLEPSSTLLTSTVQTTASSSLSSETSTFETSSAETSSAETSSATSSAETSSAETSRVETSSAETSTVQMSTPSPSVSESSTSETAIGCESTDTASSSTTTVLASTTSVAVQIPTGRVNATSLEWTLVWRRCPTHSASLLPGTTYTGASVSVSSIQPSASLVSP